MSRPRPPTRDGSLHRPLKVVASGTLFLTHTLGLPTHASSGAVIRAHSVAHARGGAASTALSILAQFPGVDALLVAPLGGNEEGRVVLQQLQRENVSTKYCKVWENAGVPSAWVMQADDSDARTIINHNPLPDITHTDFVSLLGPLLAPENYPPSLSPPVTPSIPPSSPLLSSFNLAPPQPNKLHRSPPTNLSSPTRSGDITRVALRTSPAPFDWLHFEGRSVRTTLANLLGVASLAQERGWRHRCVFSVDVGRNRQGVEALIPHADVLFLNAAYAAAHSPSYASNPRSFLLSLLHLAPPHALLVAYWGHGPDSASTPTGGGTQNGEPAPRGGAALLSVPTREYLQASGWAPADATPTSSTAPTARSRATHAAQTADESAYEELHSVRTGSSFWAGGHTSSSSAFTAFAPSPGRGTPGSPLAPSPIDEHGMGEPRTPAQRSRSATSPAVGRGRGETQQQQQPVAEVLDEVGAQDAFIAGMMYALSRRVLPSARYAPRGAADGPGASPLARDVVEEREGEAEREGGRWRLDECLRFATELSGRKARRTGWDGLAAEMAAAGWLEP